MMTSWRTDKPFAFLSFVLAFFSVLVLLSCTSTLRKGEGGTRSNRDEVRWSMGKMARSVREIQYLSGTDPLKEQEIKKRLKAIEEQLRSVRGHRMARYPEDLNITFREGVNSAIQTVGDLRDKEWNTKNIGPRYRTLTNTCGSCHKLIHPKVDEVVDLKKVMPNVTASTMERLSEPAESSCGSCHPDVLEEWKSTLHSNAWSDPIYRMSATVKDSDTIKRECRPCHSPMPVLFEEYSTDYGYRPRFRPVNKKDSISCKTCHLRPDGTVAARRTVDAPCKPRRDPRLLKPEFCGSCHNPTHNAYTEWRSSKAYKKGKTCSDCHAEKVRRTTKSGKTRKGLSHRWKGGFDESFVKKGLDTECQYIEKKNRIILSLANKTSHKFPGEVPARSLNVKFRAVNEDGEQVWLERIHIKRPAKTEVGERDTRLRPDEVRTINREVPEEAVNVTVEVKFQSSPFSMEHDWYDLGSWTFDVD